MRITTLLATMAASIFIFTLGVDIASARSSYDQNSAQVMRSLSGDDAISIAVIDGIEKEKHLAFSDISVQTMNSVVILRGEVESRSLFEKARGIAHSVPGVEKVDNRLQIIPSPPEGNGRR